MEAEIRKLAISRVFDAPRELVYRAFTDPDHLAKWWAQSTSPSQTSRTANCLKASCT